MPDIRRDMSTLIRTQLEYGGFWGQPSAADIAVAKRNVFFDTRESLMDTFDSVKTCGNHYSSWIPEDPDFYTTDCATYQTILVRGYRTIPGENPLYLKVVEKLWKHFVDEAEHFSPDQIEVIEKEFWNLG
jgi:hypothetical protein